MGMWQGRVVDWSAGEGLRAVQLFERAYADRVAARSVTERVGVNWPLDADRLSPTALWTAVLAAAAQRDLVLDLAAELLEDPALAVFAAPARELIGDAAGLVNARRVGRHGIPATEESARALLETLDLPDAANAIVPAADGELQSINTARDGWQGISEAITVLLDARRRVAVVQRGGHSIGTGFLVAPDCLLTAAHVLRPGGLPVAADIVNVHAVFDFVPSGRTESETGVRVPVAQLLCASPPTDGEEGGLTQDWDAPADRLDFALLRLPRRVADDPTPDTSVRGHYRLDEWEPDLARSTQVNIFHHPLKTPQQRSLTTGPFEFNPAGTRTRLRYRTNTEPGSSGAPLVDDRGRLLAIHHFGTKDRNQAVPIWLIARQVRPWLSTSEGAVAPVPLGAAAVPPPAAPRPHEVLQINRRPLVNRNKLRHKVWEAMTSTYAARSLVIVGAGASGISWSYLLLAHIAGQSALVPDLRATAPKGMEAVLVDLRVDILKPAAERRAALVRTISRRLDPLVSDEGIAQVARQAVDFREWCWPRLAGSERQWWIFVDSIDEIAEVARHGIDEILNVLVDLANDPQTNLRLVLAGREADKLRHDALRWAESDRAAGLTRDEVERWLKARAQQSAGTIAQDRLDGFLDTWFSGSTSARAPDDLALALPDAVAAVCS